MAKSAVAAPSVQRSGALTTGYDTTPTCIPCNTLNQSLLAIQFTKGSSSGAVVKVEFAFDEPTTKSQTALQDLTYYRKCLLNTGSPGSGTNTQDTQITLNTLEIAIPAASDNYLVEIPTMATAVRVNAKAVSDASGASMTITVVGGSV